MHHLIGSNVLSEEVVKDDANIGLKISNLLFANSYEIINSYKPSYTIVLLQDKEIIPYYDW